MTNRFPSVSLADASLELREEVEALHRVFDRRVGGQLVSCFPHEVFGGLSHEFTR